MTPGQREWVIEVAAAAAQAGHVFPRMAACEGALESGYGTSALARFGFNVFGCKQHVHPIYGTLNLPTKEFLDDQWQVVNAEWVKYDNFEEAFADRIETLKRLSDAYPHYAAALAAPGPINYINQVSQTWSTDPGRAAKVITIYNEVFPVTPDNSAAVQAASAEG
jgi:flagellum-specific peptidoglycan hydrolase FlgJ